MTTKCPLTEWQLEILKLASNGFSTKQIALKRGNTTSTLRTTRAEIQRKLKVSSITHAVATALREDWIE